MDQVFREEFPVQNYSGKNRTNNRRGSELELSSPKGSSTVPNLHQKNSVPILQLETGINKASPVICNVPIPETIQSIGITLDHMRFFEKYILHKTKRPIIELILKYQASEHEFGSSDFHSKCDGVRRILLFVVSEIGCIFGGFSSKPFSSKEEWVTDTTAFIFSLVTASNNDTAEILVYVNESGKNAIFSSASFGPTYGVGPDLYICSDSNSKPDSHSVLSSYSSDSSNLNHFDRKFVSGSNWKIGLIKDIFAFAV